MKAQDWTVLKSVQRVWQNEFRRASEVSEIFTSTTKDEKRARDRDRVRKDLAKARFKPETSATGAKCPGLSATLARLLRLD